MSQNERKSEEELLTEVRLLQERVSYLEKHSLTREQKLKLAIVDRLPFTVWACDRNFRIVLWSGRSAEIYQAPPEKALGTNYLELFVDPPERAQSREDCLKIIDEDMVQNNFLAYDRAQDGSRRAMLTNCFRIFDEETKQYLQAEVSVEISDLQLRSEQHRTLREVGVAGLVQTARTIEMYKRDLMGRIDSANSRRLDRIRERRHEVNAWFDKARVKVGEQNAQDLTAADSERLHKEQQSLIERCTGLRAAVQDAKTIEELDRIDDTVRALETSDPVLSAKEN